MAEAGRDLEGVVGGSGVELDLSAVPTPAQSVPLRRAASQLAEGEWLHARVAGVSWPGLADVTGDGFTYRLLQDGNGGTTISVWRRYTADERRRYLHDPLRPRPGYPANADRRAVPEVAAANSDMLKEGDV
jgi:hypothetical protein